MKKIILASASPRRVEILDRYGVDFETIPSGISEKFEKNEDPVAATMSIAFSKAHDIACKQEENAVVIGADTVVYCEGIMGKPRDREEALRMLNHLSGKEHSVVTGIAIVESGGNKKHVDYDITRVKFKLLSDETIEKYLERGEYKDKAGAYAIQGRGEILVDWISGSHSNVVGLPVGKLEEMLKCFGLELL